VQNKVTLLASLQTLFAKPNRYGLRLCLLLAFLAAGFVAPASASGALHAQFEPESASASLAQHNGAIDIAFPREGIAHPAIETRKKKFKLSSDAAGGDVIRKDEPEPFHLPHFTRSSLPSSDEHAQDAPHFWRARAPPRLS
jgi:hypothetical protein